MTDLGLLIEPPDIGVLAIVTMPEICGVTGRDLVTALHREPP